MKPLRGPFPLTYEVVNREVVARIGAFALGYTSADGRFCATKIGRSDAALSQSLTREIGTEREFKYLPLASAAEAFELECRLFHSLSALKVRIHPKRPGNTNWTCPICSGPGAKLSLQGKGLVPQSVSNS
jgi:hypothetical protein